MLELVIGTGLVLLLVFRGLPQVTDSADIICRVHGYLYECAGHPQQLYFILLHIVISVTGVFIVW